MKKTTIINEPILDELTQRGLQIKKILNKHAITGINIMASPGAGKTSVILKTIQALKSSLSISVIEGDVVPIDVEKIQTQGVNVVLAHTGGSCHLDSIMMEKALEKLNLENIDLLIVENVGNLICPANFYLGTHLNIVLASVPEGDDKPYKYPIMFRGADIVLLNKIDYLPYQPFNFEYFSQGVHLVAPKIPIIQLSCKTDQGLNAWINWLKKQSQKLFTEYND